jgi:hypothetical protein
MTHRTDQQEHPAQALIDADLAVQQQIAADMQAYDLDEDNEEEMEEQLPEWVHMDWPNYKVYRSAIVRERIAERLAQHDKLKRAEQAKKQ